MSDVVQTTWAASWDACGVWSWGTEGDGHMAMIRSRVTFQLLPRDDDRFTALVESLTDGDGATADQLEQEVRRSYPHAVVRPRDPLAEIDPFCVTWYVYRDGSLSPRLREEEGESPLLGMNARERED